MWVKPPRLRSSVARLISRAMIGEATQWAAMGGGAAAVALAARIGDRRRLRRRDLDKVGLMPWTTLFFVATLAACAALGLAARAWLTG